VAPIADDAGPCVIANWKEPPMSLIKRPNSNNWYYLFQNPRPKVLRLYWNTKEDVGCQDGSEGTRGCDLSISVS
jgi:hypothetical protein